MPKIEQWAKFPEALRRHLIERMHDRSITVADLKAGNWYKDFGSFKLCGKGAYPKTFLLPGQPALGTKL